MPLHRTDTGSRTEADAAAFERRFGPSYDDRDTPSLADEAEMPECPAEVHDLGVNAEGGPLYSSACICCPECGEGVVLSRYIRSDDSYEGGCTASCGFVL